MSVYDIGLCGTEEVYFATSHLRLDGGIMVTASHNPPDYNGMKFVRREARPISADSGLQELAARVATGRTGVRSVRGEYQRQNVREAYVRQILSHVDPRAIQPMRMVVNAGNGCAGPVFDAIAEHLALDVVHIQHEPDGHFPHGVPNPLLPEKRTSTSNAVLSTHARLGIAWDGDFDRCFLFDERGRFVEGYYVVGMLAGELLRRHPGATVVHDPRLTWNTLELVREAGGVAVQSRCGHAYFKEAMRAADAVYGGEMSAHHYFRDFSYCDSGMIPWLMVLEMLSRAELPLSVLAGERMRRYPVSGEINRTVADTAAALHRIEVLFETPDCNVSYFDGLSMEFADWRFNLRPSQTEPLLRLNVESRGDEPLMRGRTDAILHVLDMANDRPAA